MGEFEDFCFGDTPCSDCSSSWPEVEVFKAFLGLTAVLAVFGVRGESAAASSRLLFRLLDPEPDAGLRGVFKADEEAPREGLRDPVAKVCSSLVYADFCMRIAQFGIETSTHDHLSVLHTFKLFDQPQFLLLHVSDLLLGVVRPLRLCLHASIELRASIFAFASLVTIAASAKQTNVKQTRS